MTAAVVYWSEFLATDLEVRVRFPVLPDFLRSMGLERGILSLVSAIEELLERKRSGFGPQNGDFSCRDPPRSTRDTPPSSKSALTSPTNGGRSVDIVRLRTEATEFVCFVLLPS
jgi:hypothetical protein